MPEWISISAEMPDADLAVLIYNPSYDEPVWLGYHDGEDWRDIDGSLIGQPTHWMQMPEPTEEEVSGWIRARFRADINDPRPMTFPPPGPYWVTGEGETYAVVMAYVRKAEQVTEFWPEAEEIELEEVEEIKFTDRFPEPEWYKEWNKL